MDGVAAADALAVGSQIVGAAVVATVFSAVVVVGVAAAAAVTKAVVAAAVDAVDSGILVAPLGAAAAFGRAAVVVADAVAAGAPSAAGCSGTPLWWAAGLAACVDGEVVARLAGAAGAGGDRFAVAGEDAGSAAGKSAAGVGDVAGEYVGAGNGSLRGRSPWATAAAVGVWK